MKTKTQIAVLLRSGLMSIKMTVVIAGLIYSTSCSAQDTLIMRNGKQISSKVLEISSREIKYKKTENLEGPSYSVLKNEVDKIKFQNGSVELFEYQKPWLIPEEKTIKQSNPETPVVISPQPEVQYVANEEDRKLSPYGQRYILNNTIRNENQLYGDLLKLNNREITTEIQLAKRSRARQYVGFAAIPLGMAGVLMLSSTDSKNKDPGVFLMALSAISFGTSIYLKHDRKKHNREIVKLYNQLN